MHVQFGRYWHKSEKTKYICLTRITQMIIDMKEWIWLPKNIFTGILYFHNFRISGICWNPKFLNSQIWISWNSGILEIEQYGILKYGITEIRNFVFLEFQNFQINELMSHQYGTSRNLQNLSVISYYMTQCFKRFLSLGYMLSNVSSVGRPQ